LRRSKRVRLTALCPLPPYCMIDKPMRLKAG
jgi:hypothetical protein